LKSAILTASFIFSGYLSAQILPYQHFTERTRDKKDSSSLQYFFRTGEFYGHARYFFMATDNEAGLSDYFANAFGMGIGYETAKLKGFQIGISGFFIYNLWSSDLAVADPKTGAKNRYEMGQFDVMDPKNKHDMDRLEDLYIKYTFRKNHIKLGKQHIKTPFINPQDGRMRPTLVEGLMFESAQLKKFKFEGGLLWGVSPRGTVKWFGIGESMGIFPAGLNPDGTKSGYVGNTHSKYIQFLGTTYRPTEQVKIQAWNFHIHNVLNSSLLQIDINKKIGEKTEFFSALQAISQFTVGSGGNVLPAKSYANKNANSLTFGSKLGIRKENWVYQVNYNRITDNGRYLMPREWGRDPFFTFMSRERNEGMCNTRALTAGVIRTFGKSGFKSELIAGYFKLPDVKDAARNKYAMPSYAQINADLRYLFGGFLKGLELQMLYVYKMNWGETYGNQQYIINKTNMSLYNVVINYHF
jgi:hypothetical protein